MPTIKRIAIWSAAGIVTLVALVFFLGWISPREHTAEGTAVLPLPAEEVFALISDLPGTAAWRPSVTSVRAVGDEVFEETSQFGVVRYRVVERRPPERLVSEIVENPDFGGTWTFTIVPESGGSRLTIREDGTVSNVLFRFFARFVFGYDGTINDYLDAIASEAERRAG